MGRFFSLVSRGRARNSERKLEHRKFDLNMTKKGALEQAAQRACGVLL